MPREKPDLSLPILAEIKALWEAEFETEAQAFDSGRFRMLCHIGSSVYPEVPGSRLPNAPASGIARRELREALCHYIRWIGAHTVLSSSATGETRVNLLNAAAA